MFRYDLNFVYYGVKELSTITPTNLFEIGSRDGDDAKQLHETLNIPEDRCYVFEPNPDSCKTIIAKYPKFNTYNNAISTKNGSFPFIIDDENVGMSSLLTRTLEPTNSTVINVDCIDMASVLNNLGIDSVDVCKIDVEGAMLDVLESFGSSITKVKSIQIECEHVEIWKGQKLFDDVKEFLEKNDFIMVLFCLLGTKQSESFWIHKKYIRL
jgi:FkbM family methyltransferase